MVRIVAELDSVETYVRAEASEENVAINISFTGVTIASDEDCSTWELDFKLFYGNFQLGQVSQEF